MLRRTVLVGNVTKHPESHYLDFVIDGHALTEQLPMAHGMVTPLNRAWLSTVGEAIEQLQGARDTSGLPPRRIAVFVCGQCGDLGCGAITAALHLEPGRASWSDFAYDNGYQPSKPIQRAPDSVAFAQPDYMNVLALAEEQVAALPYDESPHQGRKTPWPWQWGWRLPSGNA